MKFTVLTAQLIIDGTLDEIVTHEEIVQALKSSLKGAKEARVTVDFSRVQRANSSGILSWLQCVRKLGCAVTYTNAPGWLVEQFNLIGEFLENGTVVRSVCVPFYCHARKHTLVREMEIGKDIPLLDDYSKLDLDYTDPNGDRYECTFDVEYMFGFLIHQNDNNNSSSSPLVTKERSA